MDRLYGGYRNQIFRVGDKIKIIWQDGLSRKEKIRDAVLLENFVATHADIKSRLLVDKSKPVQIEKGKLITYFYSVKGEIRYPWNLSEIASAAKLLGRLHVCLNSDLKDSPRQARTVLMKRRLMNLHLDFARNNVLFKPDASIAIGVIDFETADRGPLEQDLGRTLSFILIDSSLSDLSLVSCNLLLAQRFTSFLTNYLLPYKKDQVLFWTKKYLIEDNYGTLNNFRDQILKIIFARHY